MMLHLMDSSCNLAADYNNKWCRLFEQEDILCQAPGCIPLSAAPMVQLNKLHAGKTDYYEFGHW